MGAICLPIGIPLDMVGDKHHCHVGGLGDFRHVGNLETLRFGGSAAAATRVEANHNLLAVIPKVQGVGVALAAIADDADGLSRQRRQICVIVVVNIYHICNTLP